MKQRCPICGEFFIPTRSDQLCCGDACRRAKATNISKAYVVDDFASGNSIYSKESDRKEAPTTYEVVEAIDIIKDFGIKKFDIIPEFKTRAQLYMWRKNMIKVALQ